MAQEIKRRIVLEGEKEYSAALKEAQRNLKTLRSELKAETAELGANATEQQKNEAKLKNLAKQKRSSKPSGQPWPRQRKNTATTRKWSPSGNKSSMTPGPPWLR